MSFLLENVAGDPLGDWSKPGLIDGRLIYLTGVKFL
jgi:hypothetical protein